MRLTEKIKLKVVIFKLLALAVAGMPFMAVVYLAASGDRILDGQLYKTGISVFCIGSLICLYNFYTSFLRYPIHAFKGSADNFNHVSGIPLFGLLVLLGMALLPAHYCIMVVTFVLLAMDTLSISWFVIVVWNDGGFWGKNT